jgi:hypothetical protein
MKPLSGRSLTLIVLLILPSLFVLSIYLVKYVLIDYFISISNLSNLNENVRYANTIVTLISGFQITVFIVMIIVYPPYPAPYSSDKYFLNRGFQSAVSEFELVRKILYVAVPLLIFFAVINLIQIVVEPFFHVKGVLLRIINDDVFQGARLIIFFVVLAGILKMVFALGRRKFRLYFAKGCLELMEKSHDEVEKMRYFAMALNSYDSYLKRNIDLQFNDIKQIIAKIAMLPAKEKKEIMDKVGNGFKSNDTLEPVRYLASFFEQKEKELLVEEPIEKKIKTQLTYAIGIVPVVITIIELAKNLHFI